VLAAALVFGVTMTGITVYELVSGDSFSGGKGTTVSAAVTGRFPVGFLERLVGRPGDVIRLDRRRHAVRQRCYGGQSDADLHAERLGYGPSTLRK
jgi:hypothetical protein